jgi:hypothetical protein
MLKERVNDLNDLDTTGIHDDTDEVPDHGGAYVIHDTGMEETITAQYVTEQLEAKTPHELYDSDQQCRISLSPPQDHYKLNDEPDVDPDIDSYIDAYAVKRLLGDWDGDGCPSAFAPDIPSDPNIIVDEDGTFSPIDLEFTGRYNTEREYANLRSSFQTWAPRYFEEDEAPSWDDVRERENELIQQIDTEQLDSDLRDDVRVGYGNSLLQAGKARFLDGHPTFLRNREKGAATAVMTYISTRQQPDRDRADAIENVDEIVYS